MVKGGKYWTGDWYQEKTGVGQWIKDRGRD